MTRPKLGPSLNGRGRHRERNDPARPSPLRLVPPPALLETSGRSSVFLKIVVAASGAVLSGFVVVHRLGNLQIYAGRTMLNAYMDAERFGSCSNHRECEAAGPKEIRIDVIAALSRGTLRLAAGGR